MKTKSLILMVMLVFWSCTKDSEPFSINVDKTSVSVEACASTVSINVTSNGKWVVQSDENWISPVSRIGNGSETLSLQISENTTNEARTGTLTLKQQDASETDTKILITINQSQNDVILVTGDKVSSKWKGGEFELSYQDNVSTNATVVEGADWVHIIDTNGTRALTKHSLRIIVDENTGKARKGTINLKGGSTSKDVIVEQDEFVPVESIIITPSPLIISDIDEHLVSATILPENASDTELKWSISDDDIVWLEYADGFARNLSAEKNGETILTVQNPRSGVSAKVNVTVKVKATSFENFNSEINGNYGYSFSTNFRVLPSIAYIDDMEISSSDESIVKYQNGLFVCGNKTGQATVTVNLPYSNLKKSFIVNVEEYYTKAGISSITQGVNWLDLTFAGHLYSYNSADKFIINNVMFCDADGKVLDWTSYSNTHMHVYRNGTNDVAFDTSYFDFASLYGIYAINQQTFYPFVQKFYFKVTYQHGSNGKMETVKIYINPYNWSTSTAPYV